MILKLEMKKWTTSNASKERTGVTTYDVIHNNNHSQQLFEIGELNVSDAFLLSNCVILHHWWIALINKQSHIFYWLKHLEQSSIIFMDMLLTTSYIWFAKRPKKPPDPESTNNVNTIIDWISYMIYFIEDILYNTTNMDIDICYWMYILSRVTTEYVFDFINIFLHVEYTSDHTTPSKTNAQVQQWKTPYSQDQVELHEVNRHDPLKFKNGKRIQSNLVFSMSTKSSNNDTINDVMNADTDSYTAAIDTCTSESICKHKECFVGDIKPCKNVYVQGVGGSIKASGYGSVKMRIEDDKGKAFDLLIHNVIYLPESPINLISPQRWSGGSDDPTGTGELTIDGTTLLFWNKRNSTKIIPHHPELGIPIMTFNDGYTKSSAFLSAAKSSMFCLPCTEHLSYLRTSHPVTDKHNRLHIIPVEDEDEALFTKIDTQKSNRMNILPNSINDSTFQDSHCKQLDDNSIASTSASQQSLKDLAEDDDFHSSWAADDDLVNIPQNEIEQIMSAVDQQTSKLQRELLSHHYRLKHLPFPALQRLAKKGVIPKQLEKVKIPLCYACMMGKQTKRPWRGKGKKNIRHIRKPEECFAGANTSTDHMISPYGGLIPQLKGKLMRAKYYAATIFVDHYTDYAYVHLMRDSTADSTLEAKNAYEHLLATFGHKVLAYHADNGRFAESVFVQDIKDKAQNITYCGVGSHHQNGIAERRIRTLGEDARTMLAHGQHLWPEVVTKSLWAFAYKAACRSHNKFKLDEQGLSPEEKISGIQAQQDIRHEHPLFCPVFTLASGLQGGLGGIPKWNPRSNAGVYLGHSPDHASNVALVLNLTTGLVSPQYHVIFDDDFSTVDFIRSKKEPSNWENLAKFHSENYNMSHMPEQVTLTELRDANLTTHDHSQSQENLEGVMASPPLADAPLVDALQRNDFPVTPSAPDVIGEVPPPAQPPPVPVPAPISLEGDTSLDTSMGHDHPDAPLRRSSRNRRSIDRLTSSKLGELVNTSITSALLTITSYFTSEEYKIQHCYVQFKQRLEYQIITYQSKIMHYDESVELNVDGSINQSHPLSFATTTSNNEAYHFHQAMQEDDREQFIEAMVKELNDHTINNHWKLVLRSEIGDNPTIKAIWSFKRKRRPDGSLLKHKARLCAHGGMQVYGVNYWDTYAPVVNWISIRMMLTVSVIHNLYTTSIDFTLAFPQADADVEIYMEVPVGCEVPEGGDYVCLLLKNLYGTKQAAKTWFEYLRDSLIASENDNGYGFTQSEVDPCIFYKDGVTVITWVDDCLIFSRKKDLADQLIRDLKQQFTLSEEGEVSAYLGVKMDLNETTGQVTMSQPFLIQRIVELLGDGISEANTKDTPAVYKEILHKDELGPRRKQTWKYRSAIGMLNYLAASTRPDCLYAVHQCARFSADPKLSHERAVKRVIRYLKGTKDKGIILNPNKDKGIQCYVDADFAGGYSTETSEDPVSVFSRTGYVIYYYGCPVTWVSKLQAEISLSTVEAEYIALSQAMRDVIPFIDRMNELDGIFGNNSPKPNIHCTLFEDNNGALELANSPRYRPRTKHIAIKYHHFREHVKTGKISIHAIDTKQQIADIFTKALPAPSFTYLRQKLIGW
jgi:hypothetical protein